MYTYDADSGVTTHHPPCPPDADHAQTHTYDPDGILTGATPDKAGENRPTTYTYDAKGNVIGIAPSSQSGA